MSPVAQPQTLLDFILSLLSDDEARAAFDADPSGALAGAGLSGLCLSDVQDALPIVMDHAPAQIAAHYDDDVRAGTATTSAAVSESAHHESGWDGGHGATPAPHPGPHVPEIDRVVEYLQVTTNNYSFDSHDVNYSSAVEQNIVAGGDVVADIDVSPVIAGGEGSFAAGGDVAGPVATGAGAVAGDGNMVNGDGTAAFGAGDATGSVAVGSGGAVAVGDGDATGASTDTDSFGAGDVTVGSGAGDTAADNSETDDHTDNSTATDDHSDNSTVTDDHTDNSIVDNTDESDNSINDSIVGDDNADDNADDGAEAADDAVADPAA